MPYEDVPTRLASGEAVPRSEIIGFFGPGEDVRITLSCEVLCSALIMYKDFAGDTLSYGLTPLGMDIRLELITYLEGDCPECP